MESHGLNISSSKRDTADNAFGPERVHVFDFTLLFEQSILDILPSTLFILISIARVISLWQVKTCVRAGWLLWAKLVSRSLEKRNILSTTDTYSITHRRRLQP